MSAELSLSRYYSDRLVFTFDNFFKVSNSFINYFLHGFFIAPNSYTFENLKTIRVFKHILTERIGVDRLTRVCDRLKVDLDEIEKTSSPLRSRDVLKILDGLRDLNVKDIEEYIDKIKNNEIKDSLVSNHLITKIKRAKKFTNLDKKTAFELIEYLSNPIKDKFNYLPKRADLITKFLANFLFDFPLLLHEKVFLSASNTYLNKEAFFERICKRFARLEMNIGSIIPAYPDENNTPQYYRVGAKLITADGMVSYVLIPLSNDSKLEPIRVFKGTGMELVSLDFLSYLITDFEKNIGKTAFESGLKYEKYIKKLSKIKTEIGHSIGATIVSYRAANFDLDNVYLYNSPGVPWYVIEKFNKRYKDRPINLNIRRTQGDFVEYAGPYHIGYKSSNNCRINFLKFIKQEDDSQFIHNTTFFDKKRMYAITGGNLDYELNNFKRSRLEIIRLIFGGLLFSPFLRILRHIKRVFFHSRELKESGLYIEDINSKKYGIKFIKKQRGFIEKTL